MNVDNVSEKKISSKQSLGFPLLVLVDDSFEIEAKRLLTVSERINQSISRFTICNDQVSQLNRIAVSNLER